MANYIIVTRNPRTQKLAVVMDEDGDHPVEFTSEDDANRYAGEMVVCEAWGFDLVEVPAASKGAM